LGATRLGGRSTSSEVGCFLAGYGFPKLNT
jgi:hypothetical protein